MIAIRIEATDTDPTLLRRIIAGIQPVRTAPIVGRSARNAIRTHLFARDQAGNKLGGSRTHYYGAAARATAFTIEGDGVIVSIPQIGIRQRYYGGTIKPKKSKYLTIPVHPSAHGKRAREFGDLELVFDHTGRPIALATPSTRGVSIRATKSGKTTKRNVGRMGEIMFLLLKSVTQRADPAVLPTQEAMASAITPDLQKYLALLASRSGGAISAS